VREPPEHDLAVVTDVHLHTRTPPEVAEALVRLFSRLGASASRCRIVLGGDFFDFSLVSGAPPAAEAGFGVTRRERRFGLDATGEKTAWKLDRILGEHPTVLPALAGFTARGHQIVFVPGNHDEELLLPELQEHIRRLVSRAGGDPAGIRFVPWFYHEPGRIFVEHGHFYDPDNAPPSPLRPCPLPPGSRAILPLGALVTRYLLSVIRGYDARGDADRTPWPLLVKVFRSNGLQAPGIIYRYYAMAVRVLTAARRAPAAAQPPLREIPGHPGGRTSVSPEQLARLARLAAAPTTSSVRRTLGRLYLDRSAAFAAFVLSTVLLLPRGLEDAGWGLGLPALSLGVLLFTVRHGNRFGNRTARACREAAERIREILGVPVVVMGHTHAVEQRPGGASCSAPECGYVNTGSFGEAALDGAVEPPCFLLRANAARRPGRGETRARIQGEASPLDADPAAPPSPARP